MSRHDGLLDYAMSEHDLTEACTSHQEIMVVQSDGYNHQFIAFLGRVTSRPYTQSGVKVVDLVDDFSQPHTKTLEWMGISQPDKRVTLLTLFISRICGMHYAYNHTALRRANQE